MNADVEKAVERMDAACVGGRVLPSDDAWQTIRQALRDQEAEIARLRGVADLIPITWLDPLLTGPDAVIHGPPYDGRDFENLLRALRDRITAHLGGEHE